MPEPASSGAFCQPSPHVLNEALGLALRRPPSESSFRSCVHHVDVAARCAAIRAWTIARIPGAPPLLDQLLWDGMTLRGSIEPIEEQGADWLLTVKGNPKRS